VGAALDDVAWVDGDVLVVGSSTHGPMAQVFLGSRPRGSSATPPSRWSSYPAAARPASPNKPDWRNRRKAERGRLVAPQGLVAGASALG
jgi:hypothetical protein